MEASKDTQRVLRGATRDTPRIASRVIRVFLSSTFSDTVNERNVLMEEAYPKLKDFCRSLGLEFQVVDMRWGVREEAQNDHLTSSLCIKEIEKCIKFSAGPSFVAFLGQKYGYRPFPAQIPTKEFVTILAMLTEAGQQTDLLLNWYQEDMNQVPSIYRLQSVSSILENYINFEEPELMEADRKTWTETFASLQNLLRTGSKLAYERKLISDRDKEKYFISVTEEEIQRGLLDTESRDGHLVLERKISDLDQHLYNPKALKYVDINRQGSVDSDAQTLLSKLTETKIPTFHSQKKWLKYNVEWHHPEGIDSSTHKDYLRRFCNDFYTEMKKLILYFYTKNRDQIEKTGELITELLQHATICQARCKVFHGRKEIIQTISTYLNGRFGNQQPVVVTGVSGCGKTSVLAVVADEITTKLSPVPVVALRFLGTTPRSCNILNVLTSLYQQIAANYDFEVEELPQDVTKLSKLFKKALKVATKEKPLVIILDSIDQLSRSYGAFNLSWIPWVLPPNVHFIMSILSEREEILKKIKQHISYADNFIEIRDLGKDLGKDIINSWLQEENRTLTQEQSALVNEAITKCSLPLYAKLVFEEVVQWPSYANNKQLILPRCIRDVINMLFNRTEVQHGKTLVSHALAYITASRNGISEAELEDILSLDDDVLDEVYTFWLPPVRRLPPLLWTRIQEDLHCYLVRRDANGVTVLSWYHRQFFEVAEERYLKSKAFKRDIHSMLSDYFLGKWVGKQKPFTYNKHFMESFGYSSSKGQADRKVTPQPLYWVGADGQTRYNFRKLSEMPYNLYHSGRLEEMWRETVFNYNWINTKVRAHALPEMLSDISLAKSIQKNNKCGLLVSALKMAYDALSKFPCTLGPELISRLKSHKSSSDIGKLITEAETVAHAECALLPLFQCFHTPAEALVASLEGHTKQVVSVVFSSDSRSLYSISEDGHISGWDIVSGERSFNMDVFHLSSNPNAKLLPAGRLLVCELNISKSPLLVVDPDDGVVKFPLGENISEFSHGTQVGKSLVIRSGRVYDLETGVQQTTLQCLTQLVNPAVVGLTNDGKRVIVGNDHLTSCYMISPEVKEFQIINNTPASQIVITADDKTAILGYSLTCFVEFLCIDKEDSRFGQITHQFDFRKEFPDCIFQEGRPEHQTVTDLILSPDGSMVAANMKYCYVFVIHIQSKKAALMKKQHEDKHIKIVQFSSDNKFVVANCESILCTWDSSSGALLSSREIPGHLINVVCSSVGNLACTVTLDNEEISVWNIDKLEDDEKSSVVVYQNPVDVLIVSQQKGLAFIKTYIRLESCQGHSHMEHFGLDIWELKDFSHKCFLPFGNYGKLAHTSLSVDGSRLALCTEKDDQRSVQVIDVSTGHLLSRTAFKFIVEAIQLDCRGNRCLISYQNTKGCSFMALYDAATWRSLNEITSVKAAIFTLDGLSLLWHSSQYLYVYSMEDELIVKTPMPPNTLSVQAVPCQPDKVILTTKVKHATHPHCNVFSMSLSSKKTSPLWRQVSPSGILDISRDGRYAVDGYLAVYDLTNDSVVCQCDKDLGGTQREIIHVKLTDGGCHVIWADTEPAHCIRAYHIETQSLVAVVSTHSEVISFSLADSGFKVLVGCADGHFMAFGLHSKTAQSSNVNLLHPKWTLMRMQSQIAGRIDPMLASSCAGEPVPEASNELVVALSESVDVAKCRLTEAPNKTFQSQNNDASSFLCSVL